jgi:hypothetical protein
MNVAGYIALFLTKHKVCNIPGLANVELVHKRSEYDGEALHPPTSEVRISDHNSDDNGLAGFIAATERIDISRATDLVNEFVAEAKSKLTAGVYVTIPSIGYFKYEGDKLHFVSESRYHILPNIPVEKHAEAETGKTNWVKLVLLSVIAGVALALLIQGWHYLNNGSNEPVAAQQAQVADTASNERVDTTANSITDRPLHLKAILNTYRTREKAEKRAHKLTTFGNTVEVVAADSGTYYVVMPITVLPADTAHVLDSLKIFNPQGIGVLPQ